MSGTYWAIENGKRDAELRYRSMDQGSPTWTQDLEQALHFSRQSDAEKFCEEDEDAWRITEHKSETDAIEIERAWQMLEACGVPKLRAGNNLSRGIEVLSTRMSRDAHFERAMEADAARYRWLRSVTGADRMGFQLPYKRLEHAAHGVNLLQGSVAQHLDEAIDKAITAPI